jgi:hypothetical protein
MKREIVGTLIAATLAMLTVCGHADPEPISFPTITGTTGVVGSATAAVPDGDGFVWGWIDTIIFDIAGGATPTATVVVATLGGTGGGPARTILTKTITADGSFPVRDLATDQTGADITLEPALIPVYQEQLRIKVYSVSTGATVTVKPYVYIRSTP